MTNIHPSAIVSSKAQIDDGVQIGPYCIIGDKVKIGKGTVLKSHVVVEGNITIGENNIFYPFVSLNDPQDLKYKGEDSKLIIGNNNRVREYTTMNTGTEGGGMLTSVGNNCLFMMSTHVAHDCKIGNNIVMANNATLAGHVTLEDFVIIGGLSAVRQFVTIGAHAMIGGMSAVEKNVIPFGTIMGERAYLVGLNIIGLKRRNFDREEINSLRQAYERIFEDKTGLNFKEKIDLVKSEFPNCEPVLNLVEFLERDSDLSFCMPK